MPALEASPRTTTRFSAEPFRADRWLTLLARPRQHTGAPAATRIPVLMYHSISDELDDDRHPYYRTVTSPRRFEAQMRLLQREGYQAITLDEAQRRLQSASPPPGADSSRAVVITFDDGFADYLDAAHPVLTELGFASTVFLATGYLGRRFPTGRRCLSRRDVRRLAEQAPRDGRGVQFGSHTVSHPRLRDLSLQALHRELVDSRLAIETLTGQPTTLFSCPYGFPETDSGFVTRLACALDHAGYRTGVTTCIGRAAPRDDPLFLPRLPVNELDDDRFLLAKLAGGYDWLRPGQRWVKRVKQGMAWLAA